jgi:predicted ferric reductase
MNNIRWVWVGLIALLTALWAAADPVWLAQPTFLPLRAALIQLTGILGIGVMSVGLVLAVRPVVFEPALGGLDKMYRLHKWLGITGLVLAVAHWMWTQAPGWLVGLGWLTLPPRVRAAPPTEPVLLWLRSQRGLAEGLGEWAFYAMVVLIVLALVRQFPYRYFFKTHRLLAVVYLPLAFHALVLMDFGYWGQPLAWAMVVLLVAGVVSAITVLLGKVGQSRRAVGEITGVNHQKTLKVLELAVEVKGRWGGHEAGQFAFLDFGGHEGPHPFTITSSWRGDGRLRFLIKDLGDFTGALPWKAQVGDLVRIEGPYGQFNFSGSGRRQIWVGGGIGITPFISRMQRLAQQPDGKTIDLFHTTGDLDATAIGRLRSDAKAAGVHLHVLVDAIDGMLNVDKIVKAVPDWQAGDVWFCGPAGFGTVLRRGFMARGLAPRSFHQELFSMR